MSTTLAGSEVVHVATGRKGQVVKVQPKREGGRVVCTWTSAYGADVEGQRLIASGEQTQHTFARSDIRLVKGAPVEVEDEADEPEVPSDAPAAAPVKKGKKK